MERRSIETIVQALNEANVRYLVVGGLAVVAHGLMRFTADLDIVLDPEPEALGRAIETLSMLGYRPRPPVPFADFAQPECRARWRADKGLTVFSIFSPLHRSTEVDLFLEPPFDFAEAYARASRFEVSPGLDATFVALADLITMKREAGRPRDLEDVAGLESLNRGGTGA